MRKDIIQSFVEAINQQNLPEIIQLMSEDFCFVDTWGKIENKEQMKTGWQGYFDLFPDYFIEMEEYVENADFSVVIGKASASYQGNKDKYWEIPACWKVVVKENQIQLWQVFCDAKKQLDSME